MLCYSFASDDLTRHGWHLLPARVEPFARENLLERGRVQSVLQKRLLVALVEIHRGEGDLLSAQRLEEFLLRGTVEVLLQTPEAVDVEGSLGRPLCHPPPARLSSAWM